CSLLDLLILRVTLDGIRCWCSIGLHLSEIALRMLISSLSFLGGDDSGNLLGPDAAHLVGDSLNSILTFILPQLHRCFSASISDKWAPLSEAASIGDVVQCGHGTADYRQVYFRV